MKPEKGMSMKEEIEQGRFGCAKAGNHTPVIVHRSGGVPASLRNVCGICGEILVREETTEEWHIEAEVTR